MSGAVQIASRSRAVRRALWGCATWYVWVSLKPSAEWYNLTWPEPVAQGVTTACALGALADGLWWLSNRFERWAAFIPTGTKGSAAFMTDIADLAYDRAPKDQGPYWGSIGGEALISNFASNALLVGTAGSGKTAGIVMPTILTIPGPKLITDMKSELACVLAETLRARGEEVRILNFGDVNADLLGPSDSYNPLHLVANNFWRAGGLRDVGDDLQEMALQLYPDPASAQGNDNQYFRDGSRDLLKFAMQMAVLIDGYQATLGDVAALIEDREALLHHALWACGKLEMSPEAIEAGEGSEPTYARLPLEDSPWATLHDAADLADYAAAVHGQGAKAAQLLGSTDSRTADSFLTGAQQALMGYAKATRAFGTLKASTFRFADMKQDGPPVTVFMIADPSRLAAQKTALALTQWAALAEFKRSPNPKRAVHVIADEATNFKVAGLADLLTWGRGYGIRLLLIIQDLAAFRRTYGKDATDTLLSETEIKLFLPGQRNPETIELIGKMLGHETVMQNSLSTSAQVTTYFASGTSLSEDGKPLLFDSQIREMHQAILFLRRNRPALVDVPPIAAIAPLRDRIAVNPFHGKPWRLPVRARLRSSTAAVSPQRLRDELQRVKKTARLRALQRKLFYLRMAQVLRLLSKGVAHWWLFLAIYLVVYADLFTRLFGLMTGGL